MDLSDARSFPDVVRIWSSRSPDKVALIDADRAVTYAQLDNRSNRIANTLIAAGVQPGAHAGYLGKNSDAFFEIWLGVNKAGCALTPLNWRSAPAELLAVVQDAKTTLIFAAAEFTGLAEQVCRAANPAVTVITEDQLDVWISESDHAEPRAAIPDSAIALLGYTSGTTGVPKGVPISHSALLRWFRTASAESAVSWNPADIGLMVMPNFHLAGTWVSLSALYHGATLVILPALTLSHSLPPLPSTVPP